MILEMKHMICNAIAAVLLSAALVSCTKGFDEMNVNPNSPTPDSVDPNYLISPIIVSSTLEVNIYQRIHNLYNDTFAQYFANDKYTSNVCVPNDDWSQEYWNKVWGWISGLNEVIRTCSGNEKYVNSVQIARIWRVWIFSRTTDLFGDIPYSEACDGSGKPAKYDTQKDIYYDFLKELTEASEAIDLNGRNLGTSDFIFKGDMARWKAFANSLRLRLAMRLSEVDPAKAKLEAEAAVKADGGMLSGIEDDVKILRKENYYQFDGGALYYSAANLYSRSRMTMSSSMQKLLTNLGGQPFPKKDIYTSVPDYIDPRGTIYFNVTSEFTNAGAGYRGRWKGVTPGYTKAVAAEKENACTNNSRLGTYFLTKNKVKDADAAFTISFDRDQVLMYYAEICFLKAEGACRGWNMGGSAEDFYKAGIIASMKEVEIEDNVIEAYLNSTMPNLYGTTVPFNDKTSDKHNSQLAKIITQKYLANFPDNSWEAWNDYRRLGMPSLDPFAMPETGYVLEAGAMDWKGSLRRLIYPAKEKLTNEANYNEAVARLSDGDNTTSRMWWDCRTNIED